ncbi:MAG: AAA family ATPase [Flammeovirgaceae bacterium]
MGRVKFKIQKLLEYLNKGVFERDEAIKLSLLSSMAGESIFLLGAPGTAKSLIGRRIKYAYKDATSFEYLMSRFSTPEEIFGPISISKLKDQDKYERIVKNYLPAATVVFLDEIWKAGPSIQNTLLTVLNEKIYRNGEQEIQVPMKALIAASNELPAKGEGLEALWDRFLVRLIVEGIKSKDNFNIMISQNFHQYTDTIPQEQEIKISDKDYEEWSKKIDIIQIPDYVFSVIHAIRGYIEQYNQKEENKQNPIYISDRRWRKIVRLLRTSASLNDRESVDLMDCFLIEHCIWNEVEQIPVVSQFVRDAIQKHGYSLSLDFQELKEELDDLKKEIREECTFEKKVRVEKSVEYKFIGVEKSVEYKNPYIVGSVPSISCSNPVEKSVEYKNPYRGEDFFYEVEYFNCRFISKNIFENLSNNAQNVELYNSDKTNRVNCQAKKGKDKYHIILNNREYRLKTQLVDEEKCKTKKPHKKVEESWDSKVKKLLEMTNFMKEYIGIYRTEDLQHLRNNLFVNPELANIVESNLFDTMKEIEKFEIEIRKIQESYKKLQDESKWIVNIEDLNIEDLNIDEEIKKELLSHNIKNSDDFENITPEWFAKNTSIKDQTYRKIKQAIQTKQKEKNGI